LRTLRAGVADAVQHFRDRANRILRRHAPRRVPPRGVEGATAGVRVGAILHPAVLLAFVDSAGFLQHGYRPAVQRPTDATPNEPPVSVLPVSVLLVEDDPLIREFVVEALRDAGYHVIHASTGEEALEWCKRHVADVLVTDVRLPGQVDGWQIAERCREHDPELPVTYATGYSPAAPRPVPGSRIVKKPFHPDEVVRIVGELGGERRMPPN